MFEDSNTKVFVCNVTNGNAASFAALPSQSAVFFTEPQTFTEGAITTTKTTLAYKNTKGVLSFVRGLLAANIKNGGYAAYSARVEQVSYLGYNGTSGSLDAANSTYYGIRVTLNHTFGMFNNSPLMLTFPYKTDASATQSEVAAGLANAATAVLDRQAFKCMKVERINSGAQANAIAAATVSVVNGGKQIVTSDDETAVLLNGTIVRFGTSGAGTAPCYIIESQDAGAGAARIYTLDQKYQGATDATFAAATFETVTEGNWGLKFTGISVADAAFAPGVDEPFVSSFTIQSDDFTTATVTYTTKPFIGTGTYQLVADAEARSQFDKGLRTTSRYPLSTSNLDAISGDTYNIFGFEVLNDDYISPTTGVRPVSKQRVLLCVLVGLTEAFHTVLGFGA